jgi:hypothetical protein
VETAPSNPAACVNLINLQLTRQPGRWRAQCQAAHMGTRDPRTNRPENRDVGADTQDQPPYRQQN